MRDNVGLKAIRIQDKLKVKQDFSDNKFQVLLINLSF